MNDFSGTREGRNTYMRRPMHEEANHENSFLSVDNALDYVGDNSRYQKRVSFVFSFQYALYALITMGLPLLLVKPTFLCPHGQKCNEEEACQASEGNPEILPNGEEMIPQTFHLYCDSGATISLISSLFFLGSFFSNFIFPYVANSKGRRFTLFLSIYISAAAFILAPLVGNLAFLIICIFLIGLSYSGFEAMMYVYISEVSGNRFRNWASVTVGAVWSIAQIFTTFIFFIGQSWQVIFVLFLGIPFIVSLGFLYYFVQETPRYLASQRRYEEAKKIINVMCAVNRRPPFRARLIGEMDEVASHTTKIFPNRSNRHSDNPQSNAGYIELFKNPRLRKITLLLLYIWFFRNVTYYGLNYSLPYLGTQVYKTFTVVAISEFLANLLAAPVKLKMTRVRSLNMSAVLITFSCLMIIFFPIPVECQLDQATCYQQTFQVVFSVMAKFGIGFFANILVTYTSEAYPTEVRTLGMFITMQSSRLGTVAMPFIIAEFQENNINPLFCFGLMGILSFAFIYYLPETFGRQMVDLMDEMEGNVSNTVPLLVLKPRKTLDASRDEDVIE